MSQEPPQERLDALSVHCRAGQWEDAETLATSLTTDFPSHGVAWKALAFILQQTNRSVEAIAPAERSVQLMPDDAEAHNNLGATLQALDRLVEAESSYCHAISLAPRYSEAHRNLGNILRSLGRFEEAERCFRITIELQPSDAGAYEGLGDALLNLGNVEEAETCYLKAIAVAPGTVAPCIELGNIYTNSGRLLEAIEIYQLAISWHPDNAASHNNLGVVFQRLGKFAESEQSFTRAIAVKPQFAEAHYNLGISHQSTGRLLQAKESLEHAILLRPDYPDAVNNLGSVLMELGMFEEAERAFVEAIELQPDYLKAHSNLLMLLGSMRFDVIEYRHSADRYAREVQGLVKKQYTEWCYSRDVERVKVGFVSGDLKSHPVGYFLEAVLSQLQSSGIELVAYSTADSADSTAERLRPLFSSWKSLVGLSDTEAAAAIYRDGIHILFDLSGHTGLNRLPIFGWKPAPIQVSWLGYFASTGLPQMDYVLGDPIVTPGHESSHFTERIWQLPECYLCFTPPTGDLNVARLPALSNGFVTFGCFNKLSRMTEAVLTTWSRILNATPDSKLFLKDLQLDHETARREVLSRFKLHGIPSNRLILEGSSSRQDYLQCYNRVDLALSPFPYGGGTTSAEGLWMGVPVITKTGSYFLSRLGESIVRNAGLPDWVASDEDDYVAKALLWTSDLEALSDLRKGLRQKIVTSALFDAQRFASHFKRAVCTMRASLR